MHPNGNIDAASEQKPKYFCVYSNCVDMGITENTAFEKIRRNENSLLLM